VIFVITEDVRGPTEPALGRPRKRGSVKGYPTQPRRKSAVAPGSTLARDGGYPRTGMAYVLVRDARAVCEALGVLWTKGSPSRTSAAAIAGRLPDHLAAYARRGTRRGGECGPALLPAARRRSSACSPHSREAGMDCFGRARRPPERTCPLRRRRGPSRSCPVPLESASACRSSHSGSAVVVIHSELVAIARPRSADEVVRIHPQDRVPLSAVKVHHRLTWKSPSRR
jgi:hypothetical protein